MKKLKLADVRILLFMAMAVFSYCANAQKNDSAASSLNNSSQYLPQNQSASERVKDSITENRLVELALKQPKFSEADAQRNIIDLQMEKQRKAWLNLLSLSMNYNDQTFASKSNTQTAYVYPKYFFGVTVPLGLIFNNSTDVKMTKQSATIAKDQELELQQSIRANVLTDYAQYRAYEKLLAIQNQENDDAQAYFLQVQQKFSDGTATLEAYNEASAKYNDQVVKTVNLKLQQDLIKLDIEKLIGRKLEDIFK